MALHILGVLSVTGRSHEIEERQLGQKGILAAFAVALALTVTLALTGGLVYQNYCANNAEAEVSRVVFWMREGETALVTTSEDAGVEMQSEVRLVDYQKNLSFLKYLFLLFPLNQFMFFLRSSSSVVVIDVPRGSQKTLFTNQIVTFSWSAFLTTSWMFLVLSCALAKFFNIFVFFNS